MAIRTGYAKSLARAAHAHAEAGELAEAIRKYRRACRLAPGVAAWHAQLARLLDQSGELDAALCVNAKALGAEGEARPGWHAHRAAMLARLGHLDEAIAEYREALCGDETQGVWYGRLAQLLERKAAREVSAPDCGPAVEGMPGSEGREGAPTGSGSRRLREAAEAYRHAVEADGQQARWYAGLGRVLQELGDAGGAVEHYQKALELDPAPVQWRAELRRLKRLLEAGQASSAEVAERSRDASWYDDIYDCSEEYAHHHAHSVYWPVWRRIAELVEEQAPREVLEIACGSGGLAGAISERMPHLNYRGFDFSAQAIKLARRRGTPYTFVVADAFDESQYRQREFDLVICTEFLEHVRDDLRILRLLPEGVSFIGTVPDFDAVSHVRLFEDEEAVRSRYECFFDGFRCERICVGGGGKLFLMIGERNRDRGQSQPPLLRTE